MKSVAAFLALTSVAFAQSAMTSNAPVQIYMQPGLPSPTLGANGDIYTNTTTEDQYQKVSGVWTFQFNIKGSPGTSVIGASTQLTTNAAGSAVWTYPAPCTASSRFWAQPITSVGNVLVNVQNIGAPTATTQTYQVNLTNFSTVALLGLTILSVPANPGATNINVFCSG